MPTMALMPKHLPIADLSLAGVQVDARVKHHVRNRVDPLALIRLHFHIVQQIHTVQRVIQARDFTREQQPTNTLAHAPSDERKTH